ncbi:Crp/Fnr family transcriptional regulator [Saccharopolyspora sp. NPDC003752]
MTTYKRTGHDRPYALPISLIEHLRTLGRKVHFASGETLIQQHGDEDSVMLIERGLAVVDHVDESGKRTLLALRGQGELVGELAALNCSPRSATVRASTAVEVTALPAGRFRALMKSEPGLAFHVLQHVAMRVNESDRRRIDADTAPVAARLARLLLELADLYGHRKGNGSIEIRRLFTQQELGNAIGATRESVGRALATLRAQNVVKTGRHTVTVLRMDQLTHHARQQS